MTDETALKMPEVKKEPKEIVVVDNSEFANLLDTSRFSHMQRLATIFAASKMVPSHFQNDMPSTFVAMQMALRLGMDPFMFLQNTYVVHGRPGLEAKLIIALVNNRGPFEGPIQWTFKGEGADRSCTAYAVHKITGQRCEAEVSWKMAEAEGWTRKDGSKWRTLPDMMFKYRSATFLARLYCPEVIMGLSTLDELEDITPGSTVRVVSPDMPHLPGVDLVPEEPDTSEFDELAAKHLKGTRLSVSLEKFISATANAAGCTEAELKSEATKRFDDFWASFLKWAEPKPAPKKPETQAQAKPEPESKPEATPLEPEVLQPEDTGEVADEASKDPLEMTAEEMVAWRKDSKMNRRRQAKYPVGREAWHSAGITLGAYDFLKAIPENHPGRGLIDLKLAEIGYLHDPEGLTYLREEEADNLVKAISVIGEE